METHLTPLSSLRTTARHIPPYTAFVPPLSPVTIESRLSETGVVFPQWRYTMYSTTHYHSTTHEVLVVSRGRARLCFGGEQNPERFEPVVAQGDVVIVPTGLAHRLLDDMEGDFEMVGSYPPGAVWDMCYGVEGEEDKKEKARSVKWFARDPVYGARSPDVSL
ncbi:hypothetical protein ED733_005472 [Metarhizium rileyi]|uniref:Cupin type-1 domain-containing protein n=1 Tax=Metarhizium rileyi (strain RCEF 4871) TaxID=1649241 RepID=A0A5C6GEC9_METRR|nr:hypothetical protein ED733_005472 [Metarhizium rileyi]